MTTKIKESDVVRTIKGKTYVSAETALNKAKEIAAKDSDANPAKSKSFSVLRKHINKAKEMITGKKNVNEVSQTTLKSYVQKAGQNANRRSTDLVKAGDWADKKWDKVERRMTNINKAETKIKESAPSSDHIETTLAHADINSKVHGDSVHVTSFKEYIQENAFNWKSTPRAIAPASDWEGHKKEVEHDDEKGEPKPETKKSGPKTVGRPKGEYGSYKIDKQNRNTPEYKAALSKKVMDAKREGFKIRDEFKTHVNDALKKRQAEIAANK